MLLDEERSGVGRRCRRRIDLKIEQILGLVMYNTVGFGRRCRRVRVRVRVIGGPVGLIMLGKRGKKSSTVSSY